MNVGVIKSATSGLFQSKAQLGSKEESPLKLVYYGVHEAVISQVRAVDIVADTLGDGIGIGIGIGIDIGIGTGTATMPQATLPFQMCSPSTVCLCVFQASNALHAALLSNLRHATNATVTRVAGFALVQSLMVRAWTVSTRANMTVI